MANIVFRFLKIDIWPFNPAFIINTIFKLLPTIALNIPIQVKTPLICRAVRQIQQKYKIAPLPTLLTKIF